jgi:hypothetical protein
MSNAFHIQEGQIWHYANIMKAGQYGDYFLPMSVKSKDLFSNLTAEREQILEAYGDHLEVAAAPFIVDGDRTLIRLKWKQSHVDKGVIVVVDQDNKPLKTSDQELQDAHLKISFYQIGWEYLGRCGTKLIPRKIQLVSLATINDIADVGEAFGDF